MKIGREKHHTIYKFSHNLSSFRLFKYFCYNLNLNSMTKAPTSIKLSHREESTIRIIKS